MLRTDWTTISKTSLLGRMLRLPLHLIPRRTIVTIPSGINRGMKWRVGSSIHGSWLGNDELDKQEALTKFLSRDSTIFDVGAHAGFFTLAFSRLAPNGKVFAFEPLAENTSNLIDHINLNGCKNVTIYQAAVTDQTGFTGFRLDSSSMMGNVDTDGSYRVATISLDSLVTDYDIPIPNLIKMDIEGAESSALAGARHIMSQQKTVIFLALHGDEQQSLCHAILRENRYECYELNGSPISESDPLPSEIYALPAGT